MPTAVPVSRISLAVLALLVCGWYALGIVQAHDQARATSLLNQPGTPTPGQTKRILGLLDGAGWLNPDRDIDLLRGEAEIRGGEPAAAQGLMQQVLRDEPLNVDAWIELGFAAGTRDPALARLARRRERQLAPPVSPAT